MYKLCVPHSTAWGKCYLRKNEYMFVKLYHHNLLWKPLRSWFHSTMHQFQMGFVVLCFLPCHCSYITSQVSLKGFSQLYIWLAASPCNGLVQNAGVNFLFWWWFLWVENHQGWGCLRLPYSAESCVRMCVCTIRKRQLPQVADVSGTWREMEARCWSCLEPLHLTCCAQPAVG